MLRLIQPTDEERAEQACRDLGALSRKKAAHETRKAFRDDWLKRAQHYEAVAESMRQSRA